MGQRAAEETLNTKAEKSNPNKREELHVSENKETI